MYICSRHNFKENINSISTSLALPQLHETPTVLGWCLIQFMSYIKDRVNKYVDIFGGVGGGLSL